MIPEFEPVVSGITSLTEKWKPIFEELDDIVLTERRNSQNRTIKQITGHLIDSASNNIHRIVHLQHRESPLSFPNYATQGNNDRWIAIQNYQAEAWGYLVNFWYYSNRHLVHVIENIDPSMLDQKWIAAPDKNISLREMVIDYLRHLKLHLKEIEELIGL